MDEHTLQADYVIAGAGAVGLAFADTLLTDSTATMIIADRRAKPGGHWLAAYPFVRLHGPSATYGVESQPLGSGAIDAVGLNQGLHELAGGAEICAYFDHLMPRAVEQPAVRQGQQQPDPCADPGVGEAEARNSQAPREWTIGSCRTMFGASRATDSVGRILTANLGFDPARSTTCRSEQAGEAGK